MPDVWYVVLAFGIALITGVSVYDCWKKSAQQLIAFSSVGLVMLFVSVVVNPERFG